MRLAILGVVIACACKREPPPPPPPTPPTPPTPTVVAAAAPSASASAVAEVDPNLALKDIAKQWSDAINAKDIAALGAMHGASVRFYGLVVDNATYCAKMKAALAKDPTFHQDIDAIRVERPRPTQAKVWFQKKDKHAVHPSYLVIDEIDGSWKITEESDLTTDANLRCVNSADTITLTGTIDEGSFIWHDQVTPTTVLVLSSPICVIQSGDDYWGSWNGTRMDGIDSVTLSTEKPKATGTKVRVRGSHLQPHTGSGSYSTSLLLGADSITPIP